MSYIDTRDLIETRDELKQDYSELEYEGKTYLYRA